ncbi:MAG: hypothetical protein JSU85_05170 [Candidatus Zixiibacteriota bacterium]|nr:MAG: hypothetical protein JSU85_05170 [candidate division Zixibacteria bacterium]
MKFFSIIFNKGLTFDHHNCKKVEASRERNEILMLITQRKQSLPKPLLYKFTLPLFIFTWYIIPSGAAAHPGECGLDFLNIAVGAYSASTGQANYAGMEGAEAIFGNPSLLGEDLNGFASYQYLIMDTKSQAASINIPFNSKYSFALGINIFDPGEITGYDNEGHKTGNLKSGDYLVRLGIGSRSLLNYGATFSYYEQHLDKVVGRSYGFGVGISCDLGQNRIGLSAENIGPKFKISQSSVPLPSRIALSGWFPVRDNFLNLSADFIYSREMGFRFVGGIEYTPLEGFFFRAGSNNDIPLSTGLGISSGSFDFDYSYVPSGLFGARHLFSVTISR